MIKNAKEKEEQKKKNQEELNKFIHCITSMNKTWHKCQQFSWHPKLCIKRTA